MKKSNRGTTSNIKRILAYILTICLVLSLAIVSFADTVSVPEAPGGVYVLDEAEVLDLDSENALNSKSESLKADTGLELYIVTTANKGGASLKDYTYAIYDKWNIGGSEDKGLILVLDIEDDDYYLKPGDSIRETYTGTVLQGYLDTYLENDFASQAYGDGAAKLHDALSALGRRAFTPVVSESESVPESESAPESETESKAEEKSGGGFWGFIGGLFKVILVIFLLFVVFVVVVNIHGQMVRKKRREARAEARLQRQAQRKAETTSYPEKPVKAISFDEDDFEEIDSGSNKEEDDKPIEFEDFDNGLNVSEEDEDDEFIISAFDEIIANKQNKHFDDDDDIDLNDIDLNEDEFEEEDEE